jgi:hypothetical protein
MQNLLLRLDMDRNTELAEERHLLRVVRKTFAEIIKDTTPRDGMETPLRLKTVEDIRACLSLIIHREGEIADALGLNRGERPHFSDEPAGAKVVKLPQGKIPKTTKPSEN